MFPASAIGKKPTISAKTHDLKNKIFLGALTKTGADGDDHPAFFFTWPYIDKHTPRSQGWEGGIQTAPTKSHCTVQSDRNAVKHNILLKQKVAGKSQNQCDFT